MGDNKILSQNKIKIFDLFKINYFNILFFIYYKMFRKNFKTNYFIFINFMYKKIIFTKNNNKNKHGLLLYISN